MKCLGQKVQRKSRHVFYIQLMFSENRAVCEVMWKNMVDQDRPQMILRRIRIACWISKATNINSEHVILTAFPQQQRLSKRTSLLRFTYVACPVQLCEYASV